MRRGEAGQHGVRFNQCWRRNNHFGAPGEPPFDFICSGLMMCHEHTAAIMQLVSGRKATGMLNEKQPSVLRAGLFGSPRLFPLKEAKYLPWEPLQAVGLSFAASRVKEPE